MGPHEQQLAREARERGWRLRWRAEPVPSLPTLTRTELDIAEGRRLVTADGPLAVIHSAKATPRETLARIVLDELSRRGAQAA